MSPTTKTRARTTKKAGSTHPLDEADTQKTILSHLKAGTLTLSAASSSPIHTGLTLEAVDTIDGCRQRLLNAAVLLGLGLSHLDDALDPESIQVALLDVVDRLREDATQIAVTMELAGAKGRVR